MPGALAALSSRFSSLLHTVIFSFPTPSNTTAVDQLSAAELQVMEDQAGKDAIFPAVARMVQQPSEHRAMAAGIGPLTFVGSGYGVMLVVMVSLVAWYGCES